MEGTNKKPSEIFLDILIAGRADRTLEEYASVTRVPQHTLSRLFDGEWEPTVRLVVYTLRSLGYSKEQFVCDFGGQKAIETGVVDLDTLKALLRSRRKEHDVAWDKLSTEKGIYNTKIKRFVLGEFQSILFDELLSLGSVLFPLDEILSAIWDVSEYPNEEKQLEPADQAENAAYPIDGIHELQTTLHKLTQKSVFGAFAFYWIGRDVVFGASLRPDAAESYSLRSRVINIYKAVIQLASVPEVLGGDRTAESLPLPSKSQMDLLEHAFLCCGLIDIHSGGDHQDLVDQLYFAAEEFGMRVKTLYKKIQRRKLAKRNLAEKNIPTDPEEALLSDEPVNSDLGTSPRVSLAILLDDLSETEVEELLLLARHKISRRLIESKA